MKRRTFLQASVALGGLAFMPGMSFADDMFHGFDPEHVGPKHPDPANLKAMVADAMKVTPPRNGKKYVFGYTMWGGSSPFSQLNKKGLEKVAVDAGIDLITADNEWDPQKNVANAEAFATKNVDAVINSLLDIQFAGAVRAPLDAAGIPLVALDIPVPGSEWVGVDNSRAGFRAGTYLAQCAVARWGDKAKEAQLVIAAFPLVGPNGLLRNMSQEAGVRSVLDLKDDQVTWLDMKGTADSGFTAMNTLVNKLDPNKPVLIGSFSDEQLAGALRAMQVAGRSDMTIAVGMGGERLDAVASDPSFIGTVSFFPEGYADAAIPAALAILAKKKIPGSIFTYSNLINPGNVCDADPAQKCSPLPKWQEKDAKIDEAKYKAYVESLHTNPKFKDYQMLLPPVPA